MSSDERDLNEDPQQSEGPASQLVSRETDYHQQLSEVQEALTRLEHLFSEKIKYDNHKNSTIDRMHAELQTHKDGLVYSYLQPILMDLIYFYDDIGKMADAMAASSDEGSNSGTASVLENLRQAIVDILGKHGVQSYRSQSSSFDSGKQQAVSVIKTADQSRAHMVKASLREGFKLDEKILRPEGVEVYRYDSALADNTGVDE